MAQKDTTSVETIIQNINNKQYAPIYYLMGEESYYINKISDYIASHVLSEEEKGFNQIMLYGNETSIETIITAAKRFPMMSQYQVIIVKEAQNLNNIDKLSYYIQKPQLSTILVFCHMNGTLDRRKKITLEIGEKGVLFESKKLKEYQLIPFVTTYLKRKKIDIEPKAAELITDFVGSDLSRLSSELDKLIITTQSTNSHRITAEQIEKNVGISKEFNNFELKNALIERNVFKANQIIQYFEQNPKNNPLQKTLPLLFNFFSNLMLAYYAPQKTESGIAAQLELKNQWQAKEYLTAMQNYSGVKVMHIIEAIRQCDAKSKGVCNPSIGNGDLLKELIFKILH